MLDMFTFLVKELFTIGISFVTSLMALFCLYCTISHISSLWIWPNSFYYKATLLKKEDFIYSLKQHYIIPPSFLSLIKGPMCTLSSQDILHLSSHQSSSGQIQSQGGRLTLFQAGTDSKTGVIDILTIWPNIYLHGEAGKKNGEIQIKGSLLVTRGITLHILTIQTQLATLTDQLVIILDLLFIF